MEIVFGEVNNELRKLVENKPGSFTFSGFNKITTFLVEESDVEGEYKSIFTDGGPKLHVGQRISEDLQIKSIVFDDGRYKILTEKYARIDNKESQDSISDDKGSSDDKDILQK